MSNLFNTFGRAALVAIGLTFAASASAQTISCPTGFNTVVAGAGSASVQVTCQAVASCSNGQVATVTGAGTNLAIVTCETPTTTPIKPGNCSITNSPNPIPAGGGVVNFSVSCNSGDGIATYAWSGGTAQGSTSQASYSSSISPGNVTVQVVVGNGGGSTQVSKNYLVASIGGGGGTEYAACEKTPTVSTGFYPASNALTSSIGELNDNSILVIKFTVPTSRRNTTSDSAYFSSAYGSAKTRDWVLSKEPCDFDWDKAVLYQGKKVKGITSSSFGFKFSIGDQGSGATLEKGTPYYLTIRGVSGCPSGDCPYGPVDFE